MAWRGGFKSPSKLIGQLESNDENLTELDLSGNSSFQMKVREYTKRIAEAIKTNTNLKKLVLKNNGIDDAGAQALAEALSQNTSIVELNLEKNKIGSAGAEAFANGLKQNTTLIELNLLGQSKKFGEQCLAAWIECFEYNVTILKINWRLHSRQSFKINRCLTRNKEIKRRLESNKSVDDILPTHAVGVERSAPVEQPKEEEQPQEEQPQEEQPQEEQPQEEEQQEEEQPQEEEQQQEEEEQQEEEQPAEEEQPQEEEQPAEEEPVVEEEDN